MIFDVLAELIFKVGTTLGVGSSTFALLFYIKALEDGVIDKSEKRLMHVVYAVLRIGMVLIGIGLFLFLFLEGTVENYLFEWVLLGIITLNAVLMTKRIMPMRFGPVLAGGSWYALFLLSTSLVQGLTGPMKVVSYVVFLSLFYIVFSYFKNKYTKRV